MAEGPSASVCRVTAFLDHVLNAAPWVVLAIVGLVVFVEDALFVGFIVPGETAAILGGVAASMGHVPLWAVMAVVIVAAIAGDSVGYEVGKAIGPRILAKKWQDVFPTFATSGYAYPWEDIELTETAAAEK